MAQPDFHIRTACRSTVARCLGDSAATESWTSGAAATAGAQLSFLASVIQPAQTDTTPGIR
jgi:hypothetical protein